MELQHCHYQHDYMTIIAERKERSAKLTRGTKKEELDRGRTGRNCGLLASSILN